MHYIEMTFASRVVEWINEIIEQEKLPFDRANSEISFIIAKFLIEDWRDCIIRQSVVG